MSLTRTLINIISITCTISTCLTAIPTKNQWFTLMIDPAGDAHYTGRTIDNNFERGITLQAAELLKQTLEERNQDLRVVITRAPDEVIAPLQNASFANRLKTDLYCNLNFFHTKNSTSSLFIYYLQKNKLTDQWYKPKNTLSFVPYQYAHTINGDLTKKLASNAYDILKKEFGHYFIAHQPIGFPCTPLIGIQAPALSFEMGIHKKEDWKTVIAPLVTVIENTMKTIKASHE